MLPAGERITLVLEGIGNDKIRVNSSSLDYPLVILADQALEIVGIEKKVVVSWAVRSAYWLNHDPTGFRQFAVSFEPCRRRASSRVNKMLQRFEQL
jgi:hypothetical protein